MLDQIQQYYIDTPSDIVDNIYKLKSLTKSQQRSNRLGWQSLQWKDTASIPWAASLLDLCLTTAGLEPPFKHIWFNISPTKAYHSWHSHGGAKQVGVYYLKTPYDCGNIEFRHDTQTQTIEPQQGLLLIFPARLEHRVLENRSSEDRITLAFNLGA